MVVLGTGLLKPNISAIVGDLYEKNSDRKESGFTIFYMSINIGSILGFFICGYLFITTVLQTKKDTFENKSNWRSGF